MASVMPAPGMGESTINRVPGDGSRHISAKAASESFLGDQCVGTLLAIDHGYITAPFPPSISHFFHFSIITNFKSWGLGKAIKGALLALFARDGSVHVFSLTRPN